MNQGNFEEVPGCFLQSSKCFVCMIGDRGHRRRLAVCGFDPDLYRQIGLSQT